MRTLVLAVGLTLGASPDSAGDGSGPFHDDRPFVAPIAQTPGAWATFRSPGYCWSIRHPVEADPRIKDSTTVSIVLADTVRDERGNLLYVNEFGFEIWVTANPKRLSGRQWIERQEDEDRATAREAGPTLTDLIMRREEVRIGDLRGYRVRVFGYDETMDTVALPRGAYIYHLQFPDSGPAGIRRLLSTFATILGSFKIAPASECSPGRPTPH